MRGRSTKIAEWTGSVVVSLALSGCGGLAQGADLTSDARGASSSGAPARSSGGTGAGAGASAVQDAGLALQRCRCSAPTGCVTHTSLNTTGISGTLDYVSAAVDEASRKLLVMNPYGIAPYRPSLLRCELDGSSCAASDVSGGVDSYPSSVLVDEVEPALLVLTSVNPAVVRCHLDGTGCAFTSIIGPGSQIGFPTGLIDTVNRKLLIVAMTYTDANSLHLYRCELDGTGCVHSDITAGVASGSNGWNPVALIDSIHQKLVVVAVADTIGVFRCDLDGTHCAYANVSAGQGGSFEIPGAAIDPMNEKLLIVTARVGDDVPELIRCELDGTGCVASMIQAGDTRPSPFYPKVLVHDGELLTVTLGASIARVPVEGPALFRCALDGTNCRYTNLSAGVADFKQQNGFPSSVIDTVRNELLVVATNDARNELALFSVCLP